MDIAALVGWSHRGVFDDGNTEVLSVNVFVMASSVAVSAIDLRHGREVPSAES